MKTPALLVVGMALGLGVVSYRFLTGAAALGQMSVLWPVAVGGLLGLLAGAYLDSRRHRHGR